jgi:hypothetical protein
MRDGLGPSFEILSPKVCIASLNFSASADERKYITVLPSPKPMVSRSFSANPTDFSACKLPSIYAQSPLCHPTTATPSAPSENALSNHGVSTRPVQGTRIIRVR